MNKGNAWCAVLLFSVCLAVLTLSLLPEGTEGTGVTAYGSDDVGATLVSFWDSSTELYAQRVLAHDSDGAQFLFPTEYKHSGNPNPYYGRISKDGYVLTGWTRTYGSDTVSYYPGQIGTATGTPFTETKYYAVWESLSFDSGYGWLQAEDILAEKGSYLSLHDDDYSDVAVYLSREGNTAVFSVEYMGRTDSSRITFNGSGSGHGFTCSIRSSGMTVTGTPSDVGAYKLTLDVGSLHLLCYVSVYDPQHDASVIYHVTYDGQDINGNTVHEDVYGPWHTAVKLPKSVDRAQKGWAIPVNGVDALFGTDSAFVLEGNVSLDNRVSKYTYEQIHVSGVVGVLAYDCNGGYYQGEIAQLVPSLGYRQLSCSVSKDGYTLLGWNATGSQDDAIYPSGYLYDMQGEYTELKAVWYQGTPSKVTIRFVHPDDSTRDVTYEAARGLIYAVPVHGFEIDRYELKGFSPEQYEKGTVSDDVLTEIRADSSVTLYPVYEQMTFTYRIVYDPNGGVGSMEDSVIVDTTDCPYLMGVSDCAYSYEGYGFAGWSVNRYDSVGGYWPDDFYRFSEPKDTTVTLYAIWSQDPVPEPDMFYFGLEFAAAESGVTGLPPSLDRYGTESEWAAQVPPTIPYLDGHDFLGWSEMPRGGVDFYPGDEIIIHRNETVVLYAVWSAQHHDEEVDYCNVSYYNENGLYYAVTIQSGERAPMVSDPSGDHLLNGWYCAFLGWYYGTEAWDFDEPVTEDIVLNAKYLRIFSLTVDGRTVKVDLNPSLLFVSPSIVTFSDGYSCSVNGYACTHETGASGTVDVRVSLVDGEHSASGRYTVSDSGGSEEDPGDGGKEEERASGDDHNVWWMVGGVTAVLVLIAMAVRRIL